jgi:hypothetical protein
VQVVAVTAGQVGDEPGVRVNRACDVAGDAYDRRVKLAQERTIAGLDVGAPHPCDVPLGEVRDVAFAVAVGVHGIHAPIGPVARLGAREIAQRLVGERTLAERVHGRGRGVLGVGEELSLLARRGVEELLLRRIQRRMPRQVPNGVERRVRRSERRGVHVGHRRVPRRRADCSDAQWFGRAVDLEIAEPEVPERPELLASVALDVVPVHVGGLVAARGRDAAVGIEQVTGHDSHGAPRRTRAQPHDRNHCRHRTEVGHDGVGRSRHRGNSADAHRPRGCCDDVGAGRNEVLERRDRVGAEHRGECPTAVVESR